MKTKNIFLAGSLIAFAIGFSDAGESIFFYLGRPVGAILFCLFMIFMFLEKESALLDEQNGVRPVVPAARKTRNAAAKSSGLSYAGGAIKKGAF